MSFNLEFKKYIFLYLYINNGKSKISHLHVFFLNYVKKEIYIGNLEINFLNEI